MNRTSNTRSDSMGMPCLKPKDRTLTLSPPRSDGVPNRFSISLRSLAVDREEVSSTKSA